MSVIVLCGLIVIPSAFTWFNVIGSWEPFDNTKNLKVAVASVDKGYTSAMIPIHVNIGSMVESTLRANDQLDWVITDKDDAIAGTESGEYYAAMVLPEGLQRADADLLHRGIEAHEGRLLHERQVEPARPAHHERGRGRPFREDQCDVHPGAQQRRAEPHLVSGVVSERLRVAGSVHPRRGARRRRRGAAARRIGHGGHVHCPAGGHRAPRRLRGRTPRRGRERVHRRGRQGEGGHCGGRERRRRDRTGHRGAQRGAPRGCRPAAHASSPRSIASSRG